MISWSDEELADDEYPDEDDESYDDEDDSATELCSECGAEIYEDAPQCPACGCYVTASTNPFAGRSALWLVIGTLGILATAAALILSR